MGHDILKPEVLKVGAVSWTFKMGGELPASARLWASPAAIWVTLVRLAGTVLWP